MAKSATELKTSAASGRFLGESNYHTTSFMGEMDLAIETRIAGKRENTIRSPSQQTTSRSLIPHLTCLRNQWKTTHKQTNATKVPNRQQKVMWQNRFKKIDENGIICGNKPWDICDQKSTSLLHLLHRKEACRIFKSKHPLFLTEKEPMKEYCRVIE